MKLLVTVQSIDTKEPLLGFFHGWVLELAKYFDRIDIICLRKGTFSFPHHVYVHSLGKEEGESRLKYVYRFFTYVWQLRRESDIIFSHMNPHYIVLAGWFWKLLGKRMYFWRNHAKMNLKTRIAAWFSEKVFYTSPFACTRKFKHSMQMPVGIDTDRFTPSPHMVAPPRTVLFLGRLSPVKKPELFMQTAAHLHDFTIRVYGDPTHDQENSVEKLANLAKGKVEMHPAVSNHDTPNLYRTHEVYVNLTPEGSMDKTVLEAAACGALVLVANKSFQAYLPSECMITDWRPENIAQDIMKLCELAAPKKIAYRNTLREMVERNHSQKKLISTLVNVMSQT